MPAPVDFQVVSLDEMAAARPAPVLPVTPVQQLVPQQVVGGAKDLPAGQRAP
ncbi:hypothetical protein scyTo_0025717, partial [Scyliorhinus torazame]|nr:hypothetical protein [Scyliorhinus torazame]